MMKMYGAKFKEERYVKDGKYWTSAGVSAGIDMSLAIIDDLLGRKYTEAVMLDLEYDPKPPYNAGIPKKSPVCFPLNCQCFTNLSPSANISFTIN